ncbi:hypothetical protein B0H11DRAFT_2427262 [Mycena galericulata]|nr:hypothetical protein B0H11DRAFT_2427262 [Mycena galericulata]
MMYAMPQLLKATMNMVETRMTPPTTWIMIAVPMNHRKAKTTVHGYRMALLFVSEVAPTQMKSELDPSEDEDDFVFISHGPAFRLRGGYTSNDDSSSDMEANGPKRKRKVNTAPKPRKRPSKGKGKARADEDDSDSDSEPGIRVTAKSKRRTGWMFVDKIIHLDSAREFWDVPARTNRVAYVVDLSGTPGLLESHHKKLTVDGFIKKECQDSFTGPTSSKAEKSLWSNRASREAFVLVWNEIFDAIETITGKKLNFHIFSPKSKLLGVIGDSEGAQAQGLGDVIILRRMNSLTVNGNDTIDVDSILLVIWKTCIVHFHRGVFALKAYITENDLQYLLGFPYLCSETELQEYYTFCAESSVTKVQSWWAHKVSYPWLLPSLNREVSRMDKRHWDLTPRDTNPIEGSHAQDNQVNRTKRSLLDAILLTKKLDSETARIIGATMTSGVTENPNNSLETRYKNQAQRQARGKEKQREQEGLTGREAKRLRDKLKEKDLQAKNDALELKRLRNQLSAVTSMLPQTPRRLQPVAGPSNSNRYITTTPDYIDVDDFYPESPQPRRMQALNLFSGLTPPSPVAEPRSEFDYQAAMKSDVIDTTLAAIVADHPMLYPVNDDDDEVLASDPYVVG